MRQTTGIKMEELMTASDERLVKQALTGSEQAWHSLVERHQKRVYNFALRMVSHPDDAFDLMQEVFVAIHRNLATFRGEAKFTTWMLRIASYRCTDYLRRRRFTENIDNIAPPESSETPVNDAEDADRNRMLTDALLTLPDDQRLVIELKFFQQMTFEEIAGHLDISSNTAKTRMYSGLKKLRNQETLRHAM